MSRRDLRWLHSPGRWWVEVAFLAAVGLVFIAVPRPALDALEVELTDSTATLLRLYGVALVARAFLRQALLGSVEAARIRTGVIGDLLFSAVSAAVLLVAVGDGLAGGIWAYAVMALFGAEAVGLLILWWRLRGVTEEDLGG